MTDFEKDEFWKALGRLYDSSIADRDSMRELHASVMEMGKSLVESMVEMRESIREQGGSIGVVRESMKDLRESVEHLRGTVERGAERGAERQQALAETVELLGHDIQELARNGQRDSENIRALARIAEIHERRLTQIEGGETP
jgi:methyl-accepting chemotaxis protein